ncbi:MAG: TIGR00266 family protein [Acidobacteriota bacterium]
MSEHDANLPPAAPPPAPAPTPAPAASATTSDVDFRIDGRPDFASVTVRIPGEQTLKVEASAMAAMDTNIEMKTKFKGGFGRFLTGESLFINEFTARGGAGEIRIAPGPPGDLEHLHLENETVYLQNSAFVAATMGVEVESKWQGMMKGFFSGESLFLIRCSGRGDLFFNTYGAILPIEVDGNTVVDTGHIVAFTEGLDYNVQKIGSYKSLFFSGEGLVCRFQGQGRVWIQTRRVPAFAWWASPFRPTKSN